MENQKNLGKLKNIGKFMKIGKWEEGKLMRKKGKN